MSFLLKIVEGPNKGAEIALVDGVAVTLGKGDDCDIVLADATMPDDPISLEPTSGGVMAGGELLAPLQVKTLGATSFAVGPADAPWGALVWPKKEAEEAPREDAEPQRDVAEKSGGEKPVGGDDKADEPAPKSGKKRRGGCCGCLFFMLLLLMALAVLAWFFRDRLDETNRNRLGRMSETARGWWARVYDRFGQQSAEPVQPRAVTLSDIVEKYGLSLSESDAGAKISGNLKTRRERLSATAEAYAVQPGVDIDITDDESLHTAAEDALFALTEGALKVSAATNRRVVVVGHAKSAESLKRTLKALNADVPKLRDVDVSGVVFTHAAAEPQSDAADGRGSPAAPVVARHSKSSKNSLLQLPVCGILTTPYPCLISRDGRRYLEGAEIGGSVILKIGADSVVLTNSTGRFTWKP